MKNKLKVCALLSLAVFFLLCAGLTPVNAQITIDTVTTHMIYGVTRRICEYENYFHVFYYNDSLIIHRSMITSGSSFGDATVISIASPDAYGWSIWHNVAEVCIAYSVSERYIYFRDGTMHSNGTITLASTVYIGDSQTYNLYSVRYLDLAVNHDDNHMWVLVQGNFVTNQRVISYYVSTDTTWTAFSFSSGQTATAEYSYPLPFRAAERSSGEPRIVFHQPSTFVLRDTRTTRNTIGSGNVDIRTATDDGAYADAWGLTKRLGVGSSDFYYVAVANINQSIALWLYNRTEGVDYAWTKLGEVATTLTHPPDVAIQWMQDTTYIVIYWVQENQSTVYYRRYDYEAATFEDTEEAVTGETETYDIFAPAYTPSYAAYWKASSASYNIRFFGEAVPGIEIEDFDVINRNCDDWLFAEYAWYNTQINCTLIGGTTFDSCSVTFFDFASHNITYYYSNISQTAGITIGDEYCIAGSNVTIDYYNATALVSIIIPIWLKYEIVDRLYVDVTVFANTTTAETDTETFPDEFHIYSQGGAEEMIISGDAGRIAGGDFFNLYAYNNSWAKSEIYWRNLVHIKMLLKLKWEYFDAEASTEIFRWEFGFDYYADGRWCEEGFSVAITIVEYVDLNYQKWARFDITTKSREGTVAYDYLYSFFDITDTNSTSDVWIDLWFNRANASSIFGARVTAYYYAMETHSSWIWRLVSGGTWGAAYTDMATVVHFGMLEDYYGYWYQNETYRLFSQEIQLIKAWARVTRLTVGGQNVSAEIQKIRMFDLTFNSAMQGIMTPSFEDSKVPSIRQGGVVGIITSFLQNLFNALSPAFVFIGTGLVWLVDSLLESITGQPGLFSGFLTMAGTIVSSIITFMVTLATNFSSFVTVFASTISWFFTNFFSTIWGIVNFLFLTPAFNIFSVFATILGVSIAWLDGTTYTNSWGQVYDFTYLNNMQFAGFSGGIVVFFLIFIIGFFIQVLKCFSVMSLAPILEPIQLFWALVSFIIRIIEILYNIIVKTVQLLVQIAHALRDIAPRPFGV